MEDSSSLLRSRQKQDKFISKLGHYLFDAGKQAVLIHRLAHFFYRSNLTLVASLLRRINIILTGADIHPGAKFGKKVEMIHSVGVVIGEHVVVEDFCEIYGGVVLGGRGGTIEVDGQPRIGSNTVICSGAIVLGPISVGENVTVGAGSVVLQSVPDNSLVAGVPATIKKRTERTASTTNKER